MSNTGNRGVDEVALKNSISKWNSCTKVINDQIVNLDEDERVIYEELYSYWRTSSFDKAYCKEKIDSLKPYDKCHKGALLTANQEFRRRATFFYAESESNFKAFHEDMKALMGTAPTPNPTPVRPAQSTPAARTEQPQAETIDEMVSRWRKIVRLIKENQEQLSVIEQTCFEQLENFHQTSADFDPNGSSELIAILYEEVKKRGENTEMRIMLSNFLYLCLNLYTKSEDTYFEFQNTVKPRGQRVNRQPPDVNSGATTQQSRPISSQPTYGSTPVASGNSTANTITASKNEKWQDNASIIVPCIWLAYVLYSFWMDGFWSAIWEGIKSGVLGVVIFASIFIFKKLFHWLAFVGTVAIIIIAFSIRGCSGDNSKKVEEKAPTTVVVSTTTYHSISESSLNIRAAANGSARVIGTLLYNQEIEVIKITNGFAEIKHGAGVGYVSSQYIEKGQSKKDLVAQPAPTSTPAPTPAPAPAPAPQPAKAKTAVDYYNEGVNLAKSFKEAEAKVSLQNAVDMGSVDATYYLGMMYVNGGEAATGFPLVLKAANDGHKEAAFQVAELYNAGTGTTKDKTQAKVWYQKAEALGDSRATARLRKL